MSRQFDDYFDGLSDKDKEEIIDQGLILEYVGDRYNELKKKCRELEKKYPSLAQNNLEKRGKITITTKTEIIEME